MTTTKRRCALTLLAPVLTIVAGVAMTACSSDEPKSVTTTDRSVTHYDDGSSKSSYQSTTTTRE